jgi:hypothetical protein
MRSLTVSIAIASCALTLGAGVAFAEDLHGMVPSPNLNPGAATAAPGQTGSNVLASCGATSFFSIGAGAKSNTGMNSPFNPGAPAKRYAGNTRTQGNPTPPKSPNAVSQYDNACAQAALRPPMP